MYKGKHTCETLKSIRKQIADANDIPYEPRVCTHKGDCMGTCPTCESEVRYIENQLNIRKMAGKAVKIVGLATVVSLAACNSISTTDHFDPNSINPTDRINSNMSVEAEDEVVGGVTTVGVEKLPEEPFVPVEDTVYAEGEDLFDEIVHAECPNGIANFLYTNLVYPPLITETLYESVVVVFNVDEDGSISNVRVKESVRPDLDKEAISVVRKMPRWKPAISNGRQVRSKFHVTILFQKIIFENTGDVVCYPEPKSEISQSNENDDQIYNVVQKHPEFPGGQKALYEYLKTNLVYPKSVQDSSIQGRAFLSFVVEKDGSITNIKVIRGVLPALDTEAIRVVSMMPKWKPATIRDTVVRSRYILPVLFKIDE